MEESRPSSSQEGTYVWWLFLEFQREGRIKVIIQMEKKTSKLVAGFKKALNMRLNATIHWGCIQS